MIPNDDPSSEGHRAGRWLAAAGITALLLVPRWLSIYSESINWDEFAMLERAERTLRAGEVVGGGRPGLVTLMLTPFVRDCVDAVATAANARVLWFILTLAYLCGVFFLVRNWFRFSLRNERGCFEGAAAVTLLAFLPSFVAWSVQVRSDQAALAAASWAGVCLLSGRIRNAVLGGVLFGVAALCSQKALYPAALCGLLWATAVASRLQRTDGISCRMEIVARARQAIILGLVTSVTIAAYLHFVPKAAALAGTAAVNSTWEEMRWVRQRVGYSAYVNEARQAPLHALLLVALISVTVRAAIRRAGPDLFLLATCWAVIVLGLVVIVFHGSSYPYFLMTAGLFPAVAFGLAAGHEAGLLGSGRKMIIAAAFATMALGSAPVTLQMLGGSQKDQRDTTRWLRASGLDAYSGFQGDGALICQADPDPVRGILPFQILKRAERSPSAFDDFIQEFRSKPVAYVIDAPRLYHFPANVRQFWLDHYQWYHGSVWVAGFGIAADTADDTIDVIVPGRYRWIPYPRKNGAALIVEGQTIQAGSAAPLDTGVKRVSTRPSGTSGILVLALNAPSGNVVYPFIDPVQVDRLVGVR